MTLKTKVLSNGKEPPSMEMVKTWWIRFEKEDEGFVFET